MRPSNGSRKDLLAELRGRSPRPLEVAKQLLQLPRAPSKDLAVALGVLGQHQLWLEAIALLQSFWGSGALRPDIFCLNACSGACLRAVSWRSALQLLGTPRGPALDLASVNLACSAYEKASCWRSAFERLGACRAPEVLAYNAVTSASSSSSMWQRAAGMIQVMQQHSVQPTIVSFTAAMTSTEVGWSLALAALAQLPLHSLRSDAAALNAALASCKWRNGMDLGSAFGFGRGLKVNLLGQNTLIHVLGRHAQWQMASMRLCQMTRCQVRPDVVSFNSSIAAAEESNQWNLAALILEKLCSTTKPSSISFNSMMSATGSSQEWRRALREFADMSLEDPLSLATALGACQHSLKWNIATLLLAQAHCSRLSTTISGHNAALMSCEQRWLEAVKVFGHIEGLRLDEITFAATAGACQEASAWEQVLALRSLSWSGGAVVRLLLQNTVHSAWRRARQWQGSVELLREMQEEELLPDAVSFAATVQTCELGGEPGPAAMLLNRFGSSSAGLLRP